MLNFKCDLVTPIFIAAGVIRDIRLQYYRAGLSMREAEIVIRNRLRTLSPADLRRADYECFELSTLNRKQWTTDKWNKGRKL